jgi:hypothetical protein
MTGNMGRPEHTGTGGLAWSAGKCERDGTCRALRMAVGGRPWHRDDGCYPSAWSACDPPRGRMTPGRRNGHQPDGRYAPRNRDIACTHRNGAARGAACPFALRRVGRSGRQVGCRQSSRGGVSVERGTSSYNVSYRRSIWQHARMDGLAWWNRIPRSSVATRVPRRGGANVLRWRGMPIDPPSVGNKSEKTNGKLTLGRTDKRNYCLIN